MEINSQIFTPAGIGTDYNSARRNGMSQYVFHCEVCNKEFTRNLHIAEIEKGGVACPHCGSKRVGQLVTAFSAVTSRKS